MPFDITMRDKVQRAPLFRILALPLLLLTAAASLSVAQKSAKSTEPPEMLVTEEGFLAISAPKGWIRTEGPGLAYFVPRAATKAEPRVWIYIGSAPIGPKEEAKDVKGYIESDVAAFKQRFQNGVVEQETPLSFPGSKLQVPVYTFRSGEDRNVAEQVVYVGEINRVLTLVLSAKDQSAFDKALRTFHDFARSYKGSITPTPNPDSSPP